MRLVSDGEIAEPDAKNPLLPEAELWYRTLVLTISAEPARRCGRCRNDLPLSAFNNSSEFGRQGYCRECQRAWYRAHRGQHVANVNANSKRYRDRYRAFVLEYLREHPCIDCGEPDRDVLEFDHVRGKNRTVSRMTTAPLELLIAEIELCEVRCVNCHMRRTADQFGWRKAREMDFDADLFQVRS